MPRTNRSGADDLEALIDSWPDWRLALTSRPQVIGRVPAGRTNRNYRITAPGRPEDLLLRVNHPAPRKLGIDRERERRILERTHSAGIGRPFLYWEPEHRFVVFPWLSGRAWTRADLDKPAQRARLWPMIDALHAIAPEEPRRRYHAYLLDYWRQLEQAGEIDPALARAWQAFEPRLKAFDESPWPACLVHHDMIPDNILETPDRLYLIDWEYAAPGHPDIDVWSVDPDAVREPFVAEMMGWINDLWERLILA
ncbi:MAG: phosphotransferase [Xanthomonadales bacterium]|nr:phosphotransferase [Xanthomonadales bacterium]